MKCGVIIGLFCIIIGCSDKKIEQPENTGVNLQMATEGAERFEDYIHSLHISAFLKQADDSYVYYRTIANLEQEEIAALKDGSPQGNSKFFAMTLPVGMYEIYMVGNAPANLSAGWIVGKTTPAECKITGNSRGQDSVYFLGSLQVKIVSTPLTPLKVTLNRAVSKLVLVLYEVPVQIDSVRVALGNLATDLSIDGMVSGAGKEIIQNYSVRKITSASKDTIVGEIITLPSLIGGSPLQLTFYAGNGQEKIKEMPVQTLLPNKYLRIVGIVNDTPGGLLSFEVNVKLYLSDYFYEKTLPDFVINKQ